VIDEGSIQGQIKAGETCIQDVKPVNKSLNIAIIHGLIKAWYIINTYSLFLISVAWSHTRNV